VTDEDLLAVGRDARDVVQPGAAMPGVQMATMSLPAQRITPWLSAINLVRHERSRS
jgi:hypothetical protein